MVNEVEEGQRQGGRSHGKLTYKPFVLPGPKKLALFPSEIPSRSLELKSFYQVARMIKGNGELVVLDLLSNIQWARSSCYSR